MITLNFAYRGATITVRRADVRARLLQTRLYRSFDIQTEMDDMRFLEIQMFVQFLTQATIEGDLGFKLPSPNAPREEMHAAFEAFMALPPEFYDLYMPLKYQVDGLIGEADLAPPDDEKKSPPNA